MKSPYDDLLRKVWRMRKAQKEDRRWQSKATQAAREKAELEVDVFLDSIAGQAAKVRQMGLELNEPEIES